MAGRPTCARHWEGCSLPDPQLPQLPHETKKERHLATGAFSEQMHQVALLHRTGLHAGTSIRMQGLASRHSMLGSQVSPWVWERWLRLVLPAQATMASSANVSGVFLQQNANECRMQMQNVTT